MRHRNKIKKMGRTASHRSATLRNLALAIIEHKQIKTTHAKAKAVQGYFEKLITNSKVDTVHARRNAFKLLQDRSFVKMLFDDIAPTYQDRNGGYSRILKIGFRRGDAAEMAILQLVGFETSMLEVEDKNEAEEVVEKPKKAKNKATKAKAEKAEPKAPKAEAAAVAQPLAEETVEEAVVETPVADVPKVKKEMTQSSDETHGIDDYLACNEYVNSDAGFHTFFRDDKNEHFFSFVGEGSEVLLRSEGYTTSSARDKGIESVKKNGPLEKRWSTGTELDGRYNYYILKAGNHQEIGRSCYYTSEEKMQEALSKAKAVFAE